MKRRDIVKLLGLAATVPVLPAEALGLFRQIQVDVGHANKLRILTPHQDATVTVMAERIIPQTETPGAQAARVNEFIDLIVAEWFSDEDRSVFLAGISAVDTRTQKYFGKDFVDATADQQAEILRALGEEMVQQQAARDAMPRGYRGSEGDPPPNFYRMFRDLTLTGYFTSEIGFTQQLHEEIVPGRFDGCVPISSTIPAKAQ